MPQTIPNNQPSGNIARKLRRDKNRAKNDSLRGQQTNQSANERQRQELLRQIKAREKAGQAEQLSLKKRLQLLNQLSELEEKNKKNRPETPIEKAIDEYGPAEITPEQKPGEPEKEEEQAPKKIGQVPMKPEKDFGVQSQEDENAPLEQLPQKMGIEEPAKPKDTKGGGPVPTGEEKEGPLAEYGALKAGTEEPGKKPAEPGAEKPEAEKPGEEGAPAETPQPEKSGREAGVPPEGQQAKDITSGKNAAGNAEGLMKGLKGGPEAALEGKVGEASETAGKALSLYKKYKWFVWAAGIIGPLIVPILIGLLIGLVLFFVIFMVISFIDNNPGTTFLNALYCGGSQLFGGNGFDCLVKKAIEKTPEIIKAAATNK